MHLCTKNNNNPLNIVKIIIVGALYYHLSESNSVDVDVLNIEMQ